MANKMLDARLWMLKYAIGVSISGFHKESSSKNPESGLL